MATGWAREGAVQEQIDRTVEDGVARARSRLEHAGQASIYCQACGEHIPARRRQAISGVRLCVACQARADERETGRAGFNRRASKDSLLR